MSGQLLPESLDDGPPEHVGPTPRTVFLVGPPGSGKSSLGSRACSKLGLRFVDLVDDGRTAAALEELVRTEGVDVVALPWVPAQHSSWVRLCRSAGETVALWAHPLDMQARSGRREPLFTPSARLTTRGGFGRRGVACPEYRQLERGCAHVLSLVGETEEAGVGRLTALLQALRAPQPESPAKRERTSHWARHWKTDYDADHSACEILVDAMARYLVWLRARGTSPRRMAGIRSDLNAAGLLVMREEEPKGRAVLRSFDGDAPEFEYSRLFADSAYAVARFRSTWDGFSAFLSESGMLTGDERSSGLGGATR